MPVDWKLVDQTAAKYGIPKSLFRKLVRQESGGRQSARSPAGAIGLTQLMPGTARGLGVDPFNPAQNLRGGAQYLADQYKRFGRWDLALSAYNSGPGGAESSGRVEGFPETQAYVKAILGGLPPGATPPPAVPGSASQQPAQAPPGMSPALAGIFNQNQELLGVPGLPLELLRRSAAAPGPTTSLSSGAGTQGRNPRLPRGRGLISELFHDPAGAIKNGKRIPAIGGHGKHVHFASENQRVMNAVVARAKRMGLAVREEGLNDPVDPVHTEGSFHYRRYGKSRQAKAADISGDAKKMVALYRWIERRYGGPR